MSEATGVVNSAERITAHVTGHGILERIVHNMGGFFTAMGSVPGALMALGVTTAVSSVMMQLEYNQERKAIRNLYENELAAKLKKSSRALKYKDLQKLADGAGQDMASNHTFAEALSSARKRRNFGVGIAIIASLGSLALLGMAIGSGGGIAYTLAHGGASWGLGTIAQGLLGFLTYQAIKRPLHWISNKLFGLDKETAHDHIVAIHKDRHKGRFITREQVFAVFAAANKELGSMIKAQYGKEYDDLPLAAKQVVAISVGRMIALDKITDAINQGKMNPTELAFTVEGDVSGFDPGMENHSKGLFGRIRDRLRRHGHEPTPDGPVHHAVSPLQMPVYSNEAPEVSFVDRLKQSRAAEASLLQQR